MAVYTTMREAAFRTATGIPITSVTAGEMEEVDRVAVQAVGLSLARMMENAGRTLAWHVRDLGDGCVRVVAGNGGNGGGGLVCARHLANRDVRVTVVLDRDPDDLTGETAAQLRILDDMEVPVTTGTAGLEGDGGAAIIGDALIGYGLSGAMREPGASLVETMNRADADVVSLDVPSGVDATTGETSRVAAQPDRIVTLALPKTGLASGSAPLYLADIGIPRTVYDRLDIPYETPYDRTPWVELLTDV